MSDVRWAGWQKRQHKNGSFKLVDGKRFIFVHKSLGCYWIDYGIDGTHTLGTLPPVKTLRDAYRRVAQAKREFRNEPKR